MQIDRAGGNHVSTNASTKRPGPLLHMLGQRRIKPRDIRNIAREHRHHDGFWFWFLVFGFCLQYCRPVVGTLLPAKTWATCHSTLCFHRDSKVSIDSNDSLRNNTIINKLGNKHKNLPIYATPSSIIRRCGVFSY